MSTARDKPRGGKLWPGYTDSQFNEIEKTLGVAADASLRSMLDTAAEIYRKFRQHNVSDAARLFGTPKQQAAELETMLATIATACAVMEECTRCYPYDALIHNFPVFLKDVVETGGELDVDWQRLAERHAEDIRHLLAAGQVMTTWATMLRQQRDKLQGMGNGRGVSEAHTEFWMELTRIWLARTAAGTAARRHDQLQDFLLACSRPVFLAVTTDNAIAAFTRRHYSKRSAKVRCAARRKK
jgi:hypothetical protein